MQSIIEVYSMSINNYRRKFNAIFEIVIDADNELGI